LQQLAALNVIREQYGQNLRADRFGDDRIENGRYDLDAAVEVAAHPIGAGDEDFAIPTVLEAINARVLEEPADDAAHANPLADSRNARANDAHTANEHVDLNARLRRAVEGANHFGVADVIELHSDARRTARTRVLGLALDERNELAPQRH